MTQHLPLFDHMEPGTDLTQRILAEVHRVRVKQARRRLTYQGAFLCASGVGLYAASVMTVREFIASGASDYLSLIATDSDVVLAHASTFALTLAETLPLPAITLVLTAAIIFLATIPMIQTTITLAFPRSSRPSIA